jgi:hypothetical protein
MAAPYVRSICALLLLALAQSGVRADAYRDKLNHFQFDLPQGWRAMTANELSVFNKAMKEIEFDGAFCKAGALFNLPEVLYRFQHEPMTGAWYGRVEKDLSAAGLVLAEERPAPLIELLKSLAPGEAYLDRQNKRVLIHREQQVLFFKGHLFEVWHLGKNGIAQIIGYTGAGDLADFLQTFAKMNESFRFDAAFELPTSESENVTARLWYAAIGLAVVGLIYLLAQQRRQPSRLSPPMD